MRLLRYISAAAGCAATLVLCVSFAAHGQQTSEHSLGVTPAILELALDPAEPKQALITVSNLTQDPLPVKAVAEALNPAEPIAEKDRAIFDASQWIRLSEPDFILQPRQQKLIAVTVTPPPNAEPGGHYGTIFFQPLVPAAPDNQTAAYIGSKVGVLSFITVKGDIQESVAVKQLTTSVSKSAPVQLQLQLQNSGNVHIMPTGSVSIYDIFGTRLETMPLPLTVLLPKTTKELTIPWGNKHQFGYYTARADITYGTKQERISGHAVVWFLPPVFIGTVVGLGLLAFIAWRARGRWRKAFAALRG